MAASKDKASALKDSYVDGIIDELGGQSDPAVRMAIRENDVASMHSFPAEGKTGAINDGDPTMYIHGGGKSYGADSGNQYANPIPGAVPGERMLIDSKQETIDGSNDYLNEMERRMGGSGDLARMRPKSKEDFKRKPKVLGSAGGFDASNLAGAMGMEQGNTAGAVVDLQRGIILRKNDQNPRFVIKDGNRRMVQHDPNTAMPLPGGYGTARVDSLTHREANMSAGMLHNGSNGVDTSVYDGRNDNLSNVYNEQMYQSYNR